MIANCELGTCVETPKECVPLDDCHDAGVCTADGTCTNPVKAAGASCDDGVRCTAGDTCRAGACKGGDAPVDSFADFNVSFRSSHGLRVVDLANAGGGTVLLVDFPTVDPVEESAFVDFGTVAGGGSATVALPAGAKFGLALARFDAFGKVTHGSLVASAATKLHGVGLGVLNDGTAVISGDFSGPTQLLSSQGSVASVDLHGGQGGQFNAVLRADNFSDITTLEQEVSPFGADTVLARFATNGTDCVAVMSVAGGHSGRVYARSQLVETLTSAEDVRSEAWVLWFPGCAPTPAGVRRIAGGPTGEAVAFGVQSTGDGTTLVYGLSKQGLRYGSRTDLTDLIAGSAPASNNLEGFALILDAAKSPRAARSFRDQGANSGFSAIISGAALGNGFVISTGLVGITTSVDHRNIEMPLPGNPTGAGVLAPRYLLAAYDLEGAPLWANVTSDEAKDPALSEVAFAKSGIVTGGQTSDNSFGLGASQVVLNEHGTGGFLVAGWGETGRRWAGSLCRPLQSGGTSPFEGDAGLQVVSVPGSNGMVVAGVVHAPCELGFGRKQVIGEEGKVTGFLARINSADGIGCDGP